MFITSLRKTDYTNTILKTCGMETIPAGATVEVSDEVGKWILRRTGNEIAPEFEMAQKPKVAESPEDSSDTKSMESPKNKMIKPGKNKG